MTSRRVKRAAVVCALLLVAITIVSWTRFREESRRVSEIDAEGLYESIPLGCREDEAIAAVGFPPGFHNPYYEIRVGIEWTRAEGSRGGQMTRGTRYVEWGFDRGLVWVIVDGSGRVVAKWYKPNVGYGTHPRGSEPLADRVFRAVGLENPFR
jgi:hypothetical protein